MKQSQKTPEEKVELPGILGEFRQALEDEIHQIEKSGQSSTILSSGRLVQNRNGGFWYQFDVDYLPNILPDTPAKLVIGRQTYNITVIGAEENKVTVSSEQKLPGPIEKARLDNGSTVLMELLIKCIEENAEKENPAGHRMLAIQPDEEVLPYQKIADQQTISYSDPMLNAGQKNAILQACTNDITYIWGPPGTGKTTVICEIIRNLYNANRSILIVSHTNTAVDGAIEKAIKMYQKGEIARADTFPILRIGVPTRPLDNRCTLKSHIEELGKDLYEQKSVLEEKQADLRPKLEECLEDLARATWIQETGLSRIKDLICKLHVLNEKAETLKFQIKNLEKSIQSVKDTHPEIAQNQALSKSLNLKKQDLSVVEAEYASVCSELDSILYSSQTVEDEIKKHAVYQELCTQESKLMSAQFYQTEIVKYTEQTSECESELQQITKNISDTYKIIDSYERKSAIARIFASERNYLRAKEKLESLHKQRSDVEEKLNTARILVPELERQFQALKVLKAKKQGVVPCQSVDYWSERKQELEKRKVSLEKLFSKLKEKCYSLSESVRKLEEQIASTFPICEELERLERNCSKEQAEYQKILGQMSSIEDRCCEEMDRERSLCSSFYILPNDETQEKLLRHLQIEFDRVKKSVAQLDIDAIQAERDDYEKQLLDICEKLQEINRKLQEGERQTIMQTPIVGATLTKTYIHPVLRERKFDTVILDEASMASIPALWCASYLAEKNIVLVGDFLQLSPIVLANTEMAKKWLGRDIFDHSGIQEKMKHRQEPENCAKLNDQFRMEEAIANIANLYYREYGGLSSNDLNPGRCQNRQGFYSWYSGAQDEECIRLIDTENLHAWVTGIPQGKGQSRLNCFSAAVCTDLAFKCLENKFKVIREKAEKPSVLIVAPYKAHIKYIEKLVKQRYLDLGFLEDLNLINCGTIHSFQGNEADIVIFDLVIDEPHWKANLFMTGENINQDLKRMFNVAVTRAKFKLFIVGNFSYCRKRAKDNALSEFLSYLIDKQKYKLEDAKKLLPNLVFSNSDYLTEDKSALKGFVLCKENKFLDFLCVDLRNFKKRLIIYSPFMTERRLGTLLPYFADAVKLHKTIIVVTKSMSERSWIEKSAYEKCERELRALGVNVLHKKGMHEKMVLIDSTAVWTGSLNTLSFTGNTGELMERKVGKEIVEDHEKMFDIKHICDVVACKNEQRCPFCHGEMQLRDSDKGGIYWECVNQDYARSAEQKYPVDGIIRCRCGAPYKFAMKNQPRWVCTKNPAHFQVVREGDLKLEKMRELIPTEEVLKEVEKYFSDKRKEYEKEQPVKGTPVKKSADKQYRPKDQDDQLSLFE